MGFVGRGMCGGDFEGFITGFVRPEAVGDLSMQILWSTFPLSRQMLDARDAKALYPGYESSPP